MTRRFDLRRALPQRINRYARWALLGRRRQAGDTVCLIMPNRPTMSPAWLGISRVGGVVALINTKLVGRSLAHCIDVAHADHIILAHDLRGCVRDRARRIWTRAAKSGPMAMPASERAI